MLNSTGAVLIDANEVSHLKTASNKLLTVEGAGGLELHAGGNNEIDITTTNGTIDMNSGVLDIDNTTTNFTSTGTYTNDSATINIGGATSSVTFINGFTSNEPVIFKKDLKIFNSNTPHPKFVLVKLIQMIQIQQMLLKLSLVII